MPTRDTLDTFYRPLGEDDPFSTWAWPWSRPATQVRPNEDAARLQDLRLPSPSPTTSPSPPAHSVVQPAEIDLRVTSSDGVPVAAALVLTSPSGQSLYARTGEDGSLVLRVPEHGSYDARFDPPPKLPPPPPGSKPSGIYSVKVGRDASFPVATGAPRDVVLVRPAVTEICVDGWAQGSKVMRWGGMRLREGGTVATARGALRQALWLARGKTMCVCGHADPLGQDSDNEALSAERARSVALFASGDLEGWAQHAAGAATELDLDCALVACHAILGMGAAGIDDVDALDACHAELRALAGIAADARPGVDDWRAIAETYDGDLAAFMQTDRAGLADTRRACTWTDPPSLAVGERHPKPASELVDLASPAALAHRRASLLIFGAMDGPERACATPDEIYDGTYARTLVYVPGEVLVEIRVDDPGRDSIARGRAWIDAGMGASEYTAGPDGVIRFMTFAGTRVRVLAAFDANGSGTLVSYGAIRKET